MRRSFAVVVVVLGAACATKWVSPNATLTPLSISTDVPAVKSEGRIVSIEGRFARVRVDQGNGIAKRQLDNALILLRTDERTGFTRFDSGPPLGLGPTTLADIPVGGRITFMFQPSSFDPVDHSYLARVIGH